MLNDIKDSIIGYFADNFFVARLIYADADKNSIMKEEGKVKEHNAKNLINKYTE